VQATRNGWPVWVVDGKSVEFLGFQDWPNVQIVATSIEQQVAVITRPGR
jgi:DNA segregation ATPase FtsK/SpoIIIE, S-DNA-T family